MKFTRNKRCPSTRNRRQEASDREITEQLRVLGKALTLGNDEYSTSPVEQSFFRTRNLDDIYKILTELLWFRQVGANRCRLLEPRLL